MYPHLLPSVAVQATCLHSALPQLNSAADEGGRCPDEKEQRGMMAV